MLRGHHGPHGFTFFGGIVKNMEIDPPKAKARMKWHQSVPKLPIMNKRFTNNTSAGLSGPLTVFIFIIIIQMMESINYNRQPTPTNIVPFKWTTPNINSSYLFISIECLYFIPDNCYVKEN